jgi:hypothetical protein
MLIMFIIRDCLVNSLFSPKLEKRRMHCSLVSFWYLWGRCLYSFFMNLEIALSASAKSYWSS